MLAAGFRAQADGAVGESRDQRVVDAAFNEGLVVGAHFQ
jgi:hypothetical protein